MGLILFFSKALCEQNKKCAIYKSLYPQGNLPVDDIEAESAHRVARWRRSKKHAQRLETWTKRLNAKQRRLCTALHRSRGEGNASRLGGSASNVSLGPSHPACRPTLSPR